MTATKNTADSIVLLALRPSTHVDTPRAVDATVNAYGAVGVVTLCPRWYDGQLDSWGDLSMWASASLHHLSHLALHRIVAHVREAARAGAWRSDLTDGERAAIRANASGENVYCGSMDDAFTVACDACDLSDQWNDVARAEATTLATTAWLTRGHANEREIFAELSIELMVGDLYAALDACASCCLDEAEEVERVVSAVLARSRVRPANKK